MYQAFLILRNREIYHYETYYFYNNIITDYYYYYYHDHNHQPLNEVFHNFR
jgi:hypothetical protein